MDLRLDGKVAVVTGASKGIGLAVARTLAAEGAQVVGGALTVDTLVDVDGVLPVEIDLVEPTGPARLVAAAVERHGRVDVLVNNVGGVKPRLATAGIPTGRFTTPEEVAALVVFLASPLAANITGSNYVIDGGLIQTM